ncbi:MAG: hypothetical protein L0191_03205, partial [Acidobacteria bacterium]|nr:hypothetical protein [Acidobacteriota bacterium]
MLCTDAAGNLERFAKCPAGSVETHRRVIRRDAQVVGNVLKRLILKLHPQEDLAIFGFHGLGHVSHAAAHFAKQFLVYRGLRFGFAGKP